uniref:Uncharacterized protein n=1 Tax=Arcella intermedia TaxID=1963864 RepID=A0A6B2L3L7_9EUKA
MFRQNKVEFTGNEVSHNLRKEFNSLAKQAHWAESVQDETEEFLRTSKHLIEKINDTIIDSNEIEMGRLYDINHLYPNCGLIQNIAFHPSGDFLFLTYGRFMKLFEVDGKENALLQTVLFPKDVSTQFAKFDHEGNQIISCSKKKTLFIYDIPSGEARTATTLLEAKNLKDSEFKTVGGLCVAPSGQYVAVLAKPNRVLILSLKNMQYLFEFAHNGPISTLDFSPDSQFLYCAGKKGDVYVWDMKQQACIRRYQHYGALSTEVIRNCPKGLYQALGADNGVVTMYKLDKDFLNAGRNPKPWKEIFNLTTTVSDIAFNHDSQLVSIISKEKEDALRLVHLPTGTVYSNWPKAASLSYACAAFSPDSTRFCIGTVSGRILLWKIPHYIPK